jgi:hypothetical protein
MSSRRAEDMMDRRPAVSLEEFMDGAKPLPVTINGVPFAATPKHFSTGSYGWYMNGKVTVDIGGVPVMVQVGLNLTVVNSKRKRKDA